MKTMNDLFILDVMKDCVVLAGHRGLGRSVQFVNISDTPDVIQFLNENHLLLTTGYAFKDDTEKLYELIQQMHARNCSGIIIKTHRFLGQLPETVKMLADELAFPIIDLPTEHTLGNVSRHILNYLNDAESEQLYYAMHVHKEFSDMLIKGYTLSALVEQLGFFLKRPALLLNHRGEKIAHTHEFNKEPMKIVEQEIIQLVKNDLHEARHGTTYTLTSESYKSAASYPVKTKRQHESMLVIVDALTLPYPASKVAIEQASNVISFTLVKEQAIEENSRLFKNNFFADLIEKRISSEEEIIGRCQYYGLYPQLETICIVCNIDPVGRNYETLQLYEKKVSDLHNSIYDQLEDEMVNGEMNGTLFTKEKYFVLLLQFEQYSEAERQKLLNIVQNIQRIDGDFSLSFGISNPTPSLNDISLIYQEAAEAISNGYDLKKTSFIHFYKTREIKELFNMIPKKNLKELYENTLKTLAYPKSKEDVELVKTIQVYLDSHCEISETSRKLFIHRNTVKYRIEKAEDMLGRSFHDPQDSLRIRVALLIGTLLEENEDPSILL